MELYPPPKHIFSAFSSTLPEPSWAAITIGKDYIVANFEPCSCKRGRPPKVVHQEKVRIGSKGAEQARAELIGKVIAEQVVQYSLVYSKMFHLIIMDLALV